MNMNEIPRSYIDGVKLPAKFQIRRSSQSLTGENQKNFLETQAGCSEIISIKITAEKIPAIKSSIIGTLVRLCISLVLLSGGSFKTLQKFVLENLKFLEVNFCNIVVAVNDNWPNDNFVEQQLVSDVHLDFMLTKGQRTLIQ